ncbi:MAG: hypothetical protein M3Q12_05755 [Pseudomonadota bacterium]|uniref:hypothetical protein n=1 Tax=Polaromonas sp. TaxID=1869339 RepID=UPI0017BA8D31|nr:hypothetical protein [Polaromonas sp.]MBA3595076.1 hypothetical protein [Polaromonas sp.]MDQ3271661.1 hypothetical protein [Pseudomonadota bacterium]
MLSSAGVKRGDHVIDLGSGDGSIVIWPANSLKVFQTAQQIAVADAFRPPAPVPSA